MGVGKDKKLSKMTLYEVITEHCFVISFQGATTLAVKSTWWYITVTNMHHSNRVWDAEIPCMAE